MRNLILHTTALLFLLYTCVPLFSATNAVNEDNSEFRAATAVIPNLMFVKATRNGKTTSTVITEYAQASNNYDCQDIYKLFTFLDEVADVYTLAEGYALAFNKFSSYPFTAPLGVRTSIPGTVTLNFIGATSFKDVDVYLVNTLDGSEQNLKENSTYELTTDGSGDVNLFVSFRSFRNANISTKNTLTNADESIKVYTTEGNKINIKSSTNDLIQKAIVYSLSGNIINQISCSEYTSSLEIPSNKNQVCLVKVFTEKNTKTTKIFVK